MVFNHPGKVDFDIFFWIKYNKYFQIFILLPAVSEDSSRGPHNPYV